MNHYLYLSLLVIINLLLIYRLNFLAKLFGLIDYPENKIHPTATPMFGAFMFFSILSLVLLKNISALNIKEFSILIYIFCFYIIGFFDDKYNLSVTKRFYLAIIVTFIFFLVNKNDYYVSINFDSNINLILLVFISLGFLHLINMTDGINGLLISLYLYACTYFLLKGLYNYEFFFRDLLLSSFVCSLIYILPNFFGKCFLGNTGSYCIAITLSILYMELFKHNHLEYSDIILIFIIPFLDGIRVTFTRIMNKTNPFKGDYLHIHHMIRDNFKNKIIYFLIVFIPPSINFYNNDYSIIIGMLSIFMYLCFFIIIENNKNDNLKLM